MPEIKTLTLHVTELTPVLTKIPQTVSITTAGGRSSRGGGNTAKNILIYGVSENKRFFVSEVAFCAVLLNNYRTKYWKAVLQGW